MGMSFNLDKQLGAADVGMQVGEIDQFMLFENGLDDGLVGAVANKNLPAQIFHLPAGATSEPIGLLQHGLNIF